MRMDQIGRGLRFRFWKLRDRLGDRLRGGEHRRGVFRRIFERNLWGDPESASGPGSGLAATRPIRADLPELFGRLGVRTILDAPCGDFFWMRELAGRLDRYVGVDILPEIVARNAAEYGSDRVTFLCADIAADPLPRADLILCRDCLIHLPTRMIRSALRNFAATGARFLLLTNDRDAPPYRDIPIGSFRKVDFTRPPFGFPEPSSAIDEEPTGNRQLCLWELSTLPLG